MLEWNLDFSLGLGDSEINSLIAIYVDIDNVSTRRGDGSYKSSSCITPFWNNWHCIRVANPN